MYNRILFPTDGSETATAVFEYALELARAHEATVYVLNVADTRQESVTQMRGDVVDVLEREGERIVDEIASQASTQDLSVVTDVIQGEPDRTIVAYAESSDIDLIVMPTHGRSGLERFLLGSVTERVVNTATPPVLTVTPDAAEDWAFTYPPRNVLVPTDGSEGADLALEAGIDLATAGDGGLHLLNVLETTGLGIDVRSMLATDALEERATEILETASEAARSSSVTDVTTSISHGRPYREILSYVEQAEIDVVVLGTHGQTDFSRYALGGVSAKLIRTSPVPVMMVRGEAAAEGEAD
jgi:nucleotide-binding universal stress UspA family protein